MPNGARHPSAGACSAFSACSLTFIRETIASLPAQAMRSSLGSLKSHLRSTCHHEITAAFSHNGRWRTINHHKLIL
jgi:hypothetical protein